jgi:hypothetical protein
LYGIRCVIGNDVNFNDGVSFEDVHVSDDGDGNDDVSLISYFSAYVSVYVSVSYVLFID